MIGSKVTTILRWFFQKIPKTSNVGMWGVYPEANDLSIALHTQISFLASISDVESQKHFKKWGQFCKFSGSESAFSSDTLT